MATVRIVDYVENWRVEDAKTKESWIIEDGTMKWSFHIYNRGLHPPTNKVKPVISLLYGSSLRISALPVFKEPRSVLFKTVKLLSSMSRCHFRENSWHDAGPKNAVCITLVERPWYRLMVMVGSGWWWWWCIPSSDGHLSVTTSLTSGKLPSLTVNEHSHLRSVTY